MIEIQLTPLEKDLAQRVSKFLPDIKFTCKRLYNTDKFFACPVLIFNSSSDREKACPLIEENITELNEYNKEQNEFYNFGDNQFGICLGGVAQHKFFMDGWKALTAVPRVGQYDLRKDTVLPDTSYNEMRTTEKITLTPSETTNTNNCTISRTVTTAFIQQQLFSQQTEDFSPAFNLRRNTLLNNLKKYISNRLLELGLADIDFSINIDEACSALEEIDSYEKFQTLLESKTIRLRPYQVQALLAIYRDLKIHSDKNTFNCEIFSATGTGKTFIMGALIEAFSGINENQKNYNPRCKALIIEPVCILEDQSKSTLHNFLGKNAEYASTILDSKHSYHDNSHIILTTYNTLLNEINKKNISVLPFDHIDLIFVDERHHVSDLRKAALTEIKEDKLIFYFTATPRICTSLVVTSFNFKLQDAIVKGYLSPVKFFRIKPDNYAYQGELRKTTMLLSNGKRKEIEKVRENLNDYLIDFILNGEYVIENISYRVFGKPVFIYLNTIEQVEQFAKQINETLNALSSEEKNAIHQFTGFNLHKLKNAYYPVTSKVDVQTHVNNFNDGAYLGLASCETLLEGVDSPPVTVILDAVKRSADANVKLQQIIGRATRIPTSAQYEKFLKLRETKENYSQVLDNIYKTHSVVVTFDHGNTSLKKEQYFPDEYYGCEQIGNISPFKKAAPLQYFNLKSKVLYNLSNSRMPNMAINREQSIDQERHQKRIKL